MKNVFKFLGFIVFMMVIGFFFLGCDFFTLEADKDGSTAPDRTITIKNNTGYSIYNLSMKPSTVSGWGSTISYSTIQNGGSLAITLPASIPNNGIYDVRISSSGSGNFLKYYVTVTNGTTITFTQNDFYDSSQNQKFSIRNLTGYSLTCYVKPSSASDWGISLGSVSNDSSLTITLPFSSSHFNVFDIQMRSSNPTNTYTKNNITISNGMEVIYKPNDSDNSSIITPVIIIENNTGYSIYNLSMKLSSTASWGSTISYSTISNGSASAITLPASIPNNSTYDVRFNSSGGFYSKSNISISFGMTLTFTSNDKE